MGMQDSRDEIFAVGHRVFIGGSDDYFWEEIGRLQFSFLVNAGLKPDHVLYDIACGSLRGGTRFIRYLDPGHYVGFDKYVELVILGVSAELGLDAYRERRPHFLIGDDFPFNQAQPAPDFAIAQSLFSHLTPADIDHCLRQLRARATKPLRFFATFFLRGDTSPENPTISHSHDVFYYSRAEMTQMAEKAGFEGIYHGEWQHPRNQLMFEFRTGGER